MFSNNSAWGVAAEEFGPPYPYMAKAGNFPTRVIDQGCPAAESNGCMTLSPENPPVADTGSTPPMPPASRWDLCQAVMLGLGSRRFVIVRRDDPIPLRSGQPRRGRVRDLQPGDEVFYKGQRVLVRSVEIYQ